MAGRKQSEDLSNVQLSRDTLALIRTNMSMNRTVLSFLRTGLALFGAGIAVFKLFEFQYREAVFTLFCIAGAVMIVLGAIGHFKARRLFRKMRPDDLKRLEDRVGSAFLE